MSTPLKLASPSPAKQERTPHRQTVWRRRKLEREQQHALELAQELIWMADDERFSEFAGDLNKLAARVRKHGKRTTGEAEREVLCAIKYRQCKTVYDIAEETGIPRASVKRIVDEMIAVGAAELRPRDWVRGPRQLLIFLTGRPYKGIVA